MQLMKNSNRETATEIILKYNYNDYKIFKNVVIITTTNTYIFYLTYALNLQHCDCSMCYTILSIF